MNEPIGVTSSVPARGPTSPVPDEELVRRWDAGESMTAIAAAVGLSRERIRQRLKKYGRSGPNHHPTKTRDEILMHAEGTVGLTQLAHRLAISPGRLQLEIGQHQIAAEVENEFERSRAAWRNKRGSAARREYVARLRQVALTVGHTPTTDELATVDIYHAQLANVFGSANAAMAAAGLIPNVRGKPPKPLPIGFLDMYEPTADDDELEARVQQQLELGVPDTPPEGNPLPGHAVVQTTRHRRDPKVAAWILMRAAGICEACGTEGYMTDRGVSYLEAHHVVPLADGGPDTVSNAVAVCELCHGKLHRWKERESLQAQLYSTIQRLVKPTV